METARDRGLVLQVFEAIMKRQPTGFLCIFGIQYIIGRVFIFSDKVKPNRLQKFSLFSTIEFKSRSEGL